MIIKKYKLVRSQPLQANYEFFIFVYCISEVHALTPLKSCTN